MANANTAADRIVIYRAANPPEDFESIFQNLMGKK